MCIYIYIYMCRCPEVATWSPCARALARDPGRLIYPPSP